MTRQRERPDLLSSVEPLFANLLALIDERGSIVVLVTAANGGEGTSTIARALAAVAARTTWCKTALIDSKASKGIDVGAGHPLLPAPLEGSTETGKLVLREQAIGGAMVDTGTLQGVGAGTVRAETLRGVYDKLRRTYTLTVIDGPPVTKAPAAAAMARLTDGVILVAGAERTRAAALVQAHDQLEQFGATVIGVVLNKQRNRLPRFLANWL